MEGITMPAEKIDVERLAMEASDAADGTNNFMRGIWFPRRDKHFARLVLEEAAKVARHYSIDACHQIERLMP